jgi:hypothetical protein
MKIRSNVNEHCACSIGRSDLGDVRVSKRVLQMSVELFGLQD